MITLFSSIIMGPGLIPCMMSAAPKRAAVALPGMPKAKRGIREAPAVALFPASGAATPSRVPLPNSPGVLVPEIGIAGVFPDEIATKGNVAVISRSGTLIYEVLDTLKISNIGVSTAVGIGDDPISGIDFRTCLELFESDPHTEKIVMIGGPGGVSELNAASYIMEHVTKPVIAYLVGENLSTSILRPLFSQNGALVLDSAGAKTGSLVDAGVLLANTIEEIPTLLNR